MRHQPASVFPAGQPSWAGKDIPAAVALLTLLEYRGVAHGLWLRKEGKDEFLYLTVNAANPKMTPQPAMQAIVVKTTLTGEIVWKIDGPPPIDEYKPGPDGARKPYRIHPHVRRPRIRAGQAGRTARHLGRYA